MSLVTVVWSALAAACVTLAVIQFLIWCQDRRQWARVAFAFTSAGAAGLAACELLMMFSADPAQFAFALRWLQVAAWVVVVGMIAFVFLHLRAGRRWLGWLAGGLRTASLVANFVTGDNLNFIRVEQVRHVRFLGETVTVGVGPLNPWMLLGQLSLVLFVAFVVDATVAVGRRGGRRQALLLGGAVVCFVALGTAQAIVSLWQLAPWPVFASTAFAGIVVAVAYDLSRESLQAARLAAEVQRQREEVAHLSRVYTLGELSGSITHELSQPLGAILANAEAAELLLERPEPDLAEIRRILADIRADDIRAGEIIHGMRDFLRRRATKRQPLPVAQLVRETVLLIGPDAMARRTVVDESIPDGLPPILAERVPMQQVLVNLLLNAMDAMHDLQPGARRVSVAAREHGRAGVEITIADTGPGIAASDLARVFEPFHTTKPGGLGLGLPICRSIIEGLGGTITLENNPAGGAIARIVLDAAEDPTPA